MYAYRQQIQYTRPLQVVPQRRVTRPPAISKVSRKKVKAKKKNIFIEILRLLVSISFLLVFAIFVFPTTYNSLIKQVFYPTNFSIKTEYTNQMSTKNPAYSSDVDLYNIANPTIEIPNHTNSFFSFMTFLLLCYDFIWMNVCNFKFNHKRIVNWHIFA